MQIQSTNPFAAAASSPAAGATGSTSSGSSPSIAGAPPPPSESMFLQLLVAQLQHQDPTSPQDPTQFVSQLAQFSELEGVLGIQKDADTMVQSLNTAATSAPVPTSTNNPGATQSTNQSTTPAKAA